MRLFTEDCYNESARRCAIPPKESLAWSDGFPTPMVASEYAFFLIAYQRITATFWVSRNVFLPKQEDKMLASAPVVLKGRAR